VFHDFCFMMQLALPVKLPRSVIQIDPAK